MNNRIKIYTDGACLGNQSTENTGGYGAIIFRLGEQPLTLNGGYKNTTNNRMELKAAIEALKRIHPSLPVTVYSDSTYVVNGITGWIHNWIREDRKEWRPMDGTIWNSIYLSKYRIYTCKGT